MVLVLVLLASIAAAQESEEPVKAAAARSGIVIGKAEKQLTLWTKNGREVFKYDAGTIMPEGLVASLPREELRDLVAYLASLGRN